MLHEVQLAPTQTRTVPLRIHQSKPLQAQLQQLIVFVAAVSEEGITEHLEIMLHFRHLPIWTSQTADAIKASYFFAESMPTAFLALPPREPSCGTCQPPILALRKSSRIFSLAEISLSNCRWCRRSNLRGGFLGQITVTAAKKLASNAFGSHVMGTANDTPSRRTSIIDASFIRVLTGMVPAQKKRGRPLTLSLPSPVTIDNGIRGLSAEGPLL